jgi:hypothetical protein
VIYIQGFDLERVKGNANSQPYRSTKTGSGKTPYLF